MLLERRTSPDEIKNHWTTIKAFGIHATVGATHLC